MQINASALEFKVCVEELTDFVTPSEASMRRYTHAHAVMPVLAGSVHVHNLVSYNAFWVCVDVRWYV